MEHIGRKITMGISTEATRGEIDVSPVIYWMRILNARHKDMVEYLPSSASMGTIIENSTPEIDKVWGEGGVEAEIDADSLGLILLSLFGDVETSVVQAGEVWEHVFDLVQDPERPTMTIWKNMPNKNMAFPFGAMTALNFSFERGKILDLDLPMISHPSETSTEEPVFADVPVFRPKDFKFYMADDIDGLDAADETPLKSLSLEFNPNLEPDDVLGNDRHQNLLNKVFGVNSGLTLLYTDASFEDLYKAATPKAIRIELINTNSILYEAFASKTATVVTYSNLAGKTVTVGGTVLTEGVEWNRGASNDAAATSLAAAINALANVNAVAVGAVVTITAAASGVAGNSIGLSTNANPDLTVGGANLSGGVDPINPSVVFDFAKVFFTEHTEDNTRNELKKQEVKLTFAENPEEADITFGQARVTNKVEEYVATP